MNLSKQSWIRKNNIWNINANPQLIWADAVYVLSEEILVDRILSSVDLSKSSKLLRKLVMICLVYGFYDYIICITKNQR